MSASMTTTIPGRHSPSAGEEWVITFRGRPHRAVILGKGWRAARTPFRRDQYDPIRRTWGAFAREGDGLAVAVVVSDRSIDLPIDHFTRWAPSVVSIGALKEPVAHFDARLAEQRQVTDDRKVKGARCVEWLRERFEGIETNADYRGIVRIYPRDVSHLMEVLTVLAPLGVSLRQVRDRGELLFWPETLSLSFEETP